MFKNRALQVSVVKKNDAINGETEIRPYQDPEQMKEICSDLIKDTAKVIAGVFVVTFIANAICTIVVKAAEHAIEN